MEKEPSAEEVFLEALQQSRDYLQKIPNIEEIADHIHEYNALSEILETLQREQKLHKYIHGDPRFRPLSRDEDVEIPEKFKAIAYIGIDENDRTFGKIVAAPEKIDPTTIFNIASLIGRLFPLALEALQWPEIRNNQEIDWNDVYKETITMYTYRMLSEMQERGFNIVPVAHITDAAVYLKLLENLGKTQIELK